MGSTASHGWAAGLTVPLCCYLPACRRCCCRRAKYQLQHVVRTNLAASDAAYGCVFETEDEAGVRGVKLSKELMSVAGEAGGARGGVVVE